MTNPPEDTPTPATPSARNWKQPQYRRSLAMQQAAERAAAARQAPSLLGKEEEE